MGWNGSLCLTDMKQSKHVISGWCYTDFKINELISSRIIFKRKYIFTQKSKYPFQGNSKTHSDVWCGEGKWVGYKDKRE